MATRWEGISSSGSVSARMVRTAFITSVGSMVPPDFEDWITSVVFGSHSARMVRTRTAETESSVLNVIREESGLLYLVSVMGA